jgi:hypothetical protein
VEVKSDGKGEIMRQRAVRSLVAGMVLLAGTTVAWGEESCTDCHGDAETMQRLGYPWFTFTRKEVAAQTRMPAGCADCHLGNPAAADKVAAHKGLARLRVVEKKGFGVATSARRYPLEFGSDPANRIMAMTDRGGKKVRDPAVAALLWHDKRADTLTQDFATMQKSCGRCHAQEFEEFSRSTMGRNAKQSQYRGWTDERRGPHNCGPWFDGNFDRMQANTTIPMSRESHLANQKACNLCHVGCLDCHYDPQPKKANDQAMGSHTFARTPPPASCYGNGRGSVCHAGPEDRRRGAGYFGGSFSFPEGSEPDVHLKAGVGCLECHESSRDNPALGHGMIRRQARGACVRCHERAVQSHAVSRHKNLACEACHVQRVGGYQGTYWGPGRLAGVATPFFKYKAYYGIMAEPILIRSQQGLWIPVKPYPMAALNQKAAPFTPGLHWRYPADLPDPERTDDAWAFTGIHGGLPENNRALTWIQMDKVSHKLGKSRSCDSCHADPQGVQSQTVTWVYEDPGAAPFKGSHRVAASALGLAITGIRAAEKIEPEPGYLLSSFAPWLYLGDVWQVKGDFALPPILDRAAYELLRLNREGARTAGVMHR